MADKYPDLSKPAASNQGSYPDLSKPASQVNTFLGEMPSPQAFQEHLSSPDNVNEMINEVGGAIPGMQLIGKGLKSIGSTVGNAFTHVKPYEEAAQKTAQEHEAAIMQGKEGTDAAKNILGSEEGKISDFLNKGQNYKQAISSGIKNRVNSIEDYWKNSYGTFKSKIKDLKVSMPESVLNKYDVDMNAINEAIKQPGGLERIKAGKIGMADGGNEYLKDLLDIAPSSQHKSASEFLDKLQDFKTARYELGQQAKEATTRAERKNIFEALDKTKEIESKAQGALKDSLGEHGPELERLNKGYSEQVHPLKGNSIVNKSKFGALPKDIMEAVNSNEPGMSQLKEIIKQDPELLRNVIGQKYSLNPEKLHAIGSHEREFVNEVPQLQDLLTNHKNAIENVEKSLQKHAARSDISLKEKIKAEGELKRIKDLKKKSMKKVLIGGGVVGVPTTGKYILNALTEPSSDNTQYDQQGAQ